MADVLQEDYNSDADLNNPKEIVNIIVKDYKDEFKSKLEDKKELDYIDKIFNDFIYTVTWNKDISDGPIESINIQSLFIYAKYLKNNKIEWFEFIKEEDIKNLDDIFSKLWDYNPFAITKEQRQKENDIFERIMEKIIEIKGDKELKQLLKQKMKKK